MLCREIFARFSRICIKWHQKKKNVLTLGALTLLEAGGPYTPFELVAAYILELGRN